MTATDDAVPPKYALGVLFVHGIGRQQEGDTLVAWGDTLAGLINEADPDAVAQVETARLRSDDAAEPARAEMSLEVGGHRSSWLLAEAWWAEAFATPSYRQLLSWSFRALPSIVVLHFAGAFRRVRSKQRAETRSLRKLLTAIELWIGVVAGFVAALLLSPLLLVLLALMLVIGAIPLPSLRSAVANAQRALVASVGDSLILLESPIQGAAMRGTVRRGLQFLEDQGCDRLAVVAHSQGAAVAIEALGGLDVREQRYQPPQRLETLVTFGAGIRKLAGLKVVSLRGRGSVVPGANPMWVASGMMAAFVAVAVLVWTSLGSESGSLSELGEALLYFFFVMVAMAAGGAAMAIAAQVGASEKTQQRVLTIVIVVGLIGAITYLAVADIDWLWIAAVIVPVFAVLSVAELLRGNFDEQLIAAVHRPDGIEVWLDFYGSADPVPNGPTVATHGPLSVEIWNRASLLRDHNSYWTNRDTFVLPLAHTLAGAAGSPLADRLPDVSEEVVDRRRWRVGWLEASRWIVLLAVVLYAIGFAGDLEELGRWVRDIASDVVGAIPLVSDTLVPAASDRGAEVVGVLSIAVAGLAGSSITAGAWRLWSRFEEGQVLKHVIPGGTPRPFWWFATALVGVVASGIGIAELRDEPAGAGFLWLGTVLIGLVPVWLATRKARNQHVAANAADSGD